MKTVLSEKQAVEVLNKIDLSKLTVGSAKVIEISTFLATDRRYRITSFIIIMPRTSTVKNTQNIIETYKKVKVKLTFISRMLIIKLTFCTSQ